ncbi:hypothetical protein [Psychroserpens sp.]|uniref:hypothetical protein n=1 Tax=Psychroserpens sp. TaxID=2020870 RepID=UPI002B2720C7|nr:hypothetical protein [Psychroserpens sp.]
MKSNILICLLCFSITGLVSAQDKPQDLVDNFFKNFETKGATFALDELYRGNTWISRNNDAVEKLKTQMEGLNENFVGKYYGKEVILEKKLSDSFVLISYLVKYDRQPLRFTFQFYRPDDTWRIQSFSYDGDLDDEIEEAAKLYRYRLN